MLLLLLTSNARKSEGLGTTVVENTKHGKGIPYRRLPRGVRAVARGAAAVFVLDSEEEEEEEERDREKEK